MGGPMKLSQIDIDNYKRNNSGFMFYKTYAKDTIIESCSHCYTEVEIQIIAKKNFSKMWF